MKNIKRILAVVLACLFVAGLTACHKKGEIAVKVGDKEFTSGYYACALYFADGEARQKVYDQVSEEGGDTSNIDYFSRQIDGKSYVDWVKEEAIKDIKKAAASKIYCEKAGIELDESAKNSAVSYAESYWSYYSETFTKNGFSKETLTAFLTDQSYNDLYFDHIYGAEGEKAVTEEQLKAHLSENLLIADIIEADFTDLEEEQITEKTEQLNGYLNDLNSGKRTFEEINAEYNGTDDEAEDTAEETANEDGIEASGPADSLAKLIGKPDTDYAGTYSDYFEEILAMQTGEVKIIDKPDNAGKLLVVKKDILEDPYYLSTYDETFRHSIADEDFDKDVEDYANTLYFESIAYAVNRFDVKKIYHG